MKNKSFWCTLIFLCFYCFWLFFAQLQSKWIKVSVARSESMLIKTKYILMFSILYIFSLFFWTLKIGEPFIFIINDIYRHHSFFAFIITLFLLIWLIVRHMSNKCKLGSLCTKSSWCNHLKLSSTLPGDVKHWNVCCKKFLYKQLHVLFPIQLLFCNFYFNRTNFLN